MDTQTQVARLESERIAGSVRPGQGRSRGGKGPLGIHTNISSLRRVVTEKRIDTGSMASPGMPLLVIEDTSRYTIGAPIDERLLHPDQARHARFRYL